MYIIDIDWLRFVLLLLIIVCDFPFHPGDNNPISQQLRISKPS